MKIITVFLSLLFLYLGVIAYGQDSIPVAVSSSIFENFDADEWLHLKITDTLSSKVLYDSIATVTKAFGFNDTIYLDSGTYKCEIIDMGAGVSMPVIKLNNGHIVQWGYPEYQYYLFTVPGDFNSSSAITKTSCDSFISPSSKYIWYTSGMYMDTIPNAINHDSIITVSLTIKNSTNSTLIDTACFSFTSPSGKQWNSSGTYADIIPNACGCDSTITIDLTVISIDTSVTLNESVLTANQLEANYQWLICNTGFTINGAIDQSYTPIVNGLYAVRIKKNGCIATSSCFSILVTELNEYKLENSISLYPNPVKDKLTIELNKTYNIIEVEIDDISGRRVLFKNFKNHSRIHINMENFKEGIYFLQLKADIVKTAFKILKP